MYATKATGADRDFVHSTNTNLDALSVTVNKYRLPVAEVGVIGPQKSDHTISPGRAVTCWDVCGALFS